MDPVSLAELTVDDVRCFAHTALEFHPALNLVVGPNGSGKTTLLEAVFLLGRGRSFRTRSSERLIRHGQDRLVVFGRTGDTPARALGIQVSRVDGTRARLNGTAVGALTDLTQALPVQVIDPGVHKLVEEGGYRRRRWLDWLVFHVEPSYVDHWLRYTRALRQRNAALKSQPGQASVWNAELSRLGEQIAAARGRVLELLLPHWHSAVAALADLPVDLRYARGWPADLPLLESLEASFARDQVRGVTHSGPHRADVLVRLGGRPAREVLSRGQQKLIAIAMTLAQLSLLQQLEHPAATLLLDDPAAELDRERLSRFIERIVSLRCQLIVTSLQPEFDAFGIPDRVFHVEQGRARQVV